ncbi:MAG: hypothetical protein A2725_00265 [Candidatus Magasanikbacteria bacterium RIFCSPHIGHO2_01_FULL_33_34]|uniref:riboflavin kinase n=1 Tax=Candidatus Magasanikbacteria bacterium RIFCSPHIGHO2_01_FULL_33_34 TaxID=1798671 RepID=A0A1F6LKZ5_9BACT|nr:MAG: hypothetical protein A2725_00265 [Candidatus Magasanikbacteria bacterium RIFCSPHIGHO2_01_FULL_33_34]OGH65795.1 MAG: hypothetical protein A3B83_02935 [Candidatus Magasanikbacteria bacterium RIFCSPHIGHO2_02_FULL_33_17]OGH75160.1 MAG: hypothetical protein A3A89_03530 [Candidatus Magasanikbacteria bacterium RIFCSPLOWO2_01_FULL_33_34]OGH81549.1 MAG: hypothetical protein A3F93_00595 [Candidatus Magasanikbacteria bacterium RIFCSPLOWO2_12_FULL_34_7]
MAEYSVSGIVVKGDGLAKNFGYPTANLDISLDKFDLASGVYACIAYLENIQYNAVAIIKRNESKFEVHLIGYDGLDFYMKQVSINLLSKVSDIEKKDGQELIDKIESDMKKVFDYFSRKIQ